MRYAAISLLVCIALAGYAAPAAKPPVAIDTSEGSPGNLIANSDFEATGADGLPSSWFSKIASSPEKVAEVDQHRGGYNSKSCLMIACKTTKVVYGAYSQPANLPPGTEELIVSFYERTERIPQPDVYILLYKTNFATKEWQTPYVQSEDRAIPNSPGWRLMAWRFKIVPGCKQAVLAFRGVGDGALYVDDVAMRAYPQVADCKVVKAGQVTRMPKERTISVDVKPTGGPPAKLTASLLLQSKGKSWVAWRQDFQTNSETVLKGKYELPYDQTAKALLTITGAKPDQVYDAQRFEVPALIGGELLRPAFRGTVLRGVPCPNIEAAGTINASDALASKVKLTARLAGSNRIATPGTGLDRPTPETWTTSIASKNLLTGKYAMHLEAKLDGKTCSLDLPVVVAPDTGFHVGYDSTGTMYIDGRPRLPIGVYFATGPDDLRLAKAAGYNFSVIPWNLASTATMDYAASINMKVLIEALSFEYSFWEHAVDKYSTHPNPALLGWHLAGKPDAELDLPYTMIDVHNKIASLDPNHAVVTSLTMPSLMSEYAPGCDIALVWTDPIPESGPATVGMLLDGARKAMAPKPVWAIIQTVGHAWSWDKRLGDTTDGRPPTPAEHRCMRFLALVHGARGIIDYAYVMDGSPKGKAWSLIADDPDLWKQITKTNRQLAWLEPFIAGKKWYPVELDSTAPVHVAYWQGTDRLLAIAVNVTDQPQAYAFKLPPVEKNTLSDPMTGDKIVGAGDGQFGVALGPYGVATLVGRTLPQ